MNHEDYIPKFVIKIVLLHEAMSFVKTTNVLASDYDIIRETMKFYCGVAILCSCLKEYVDSGGDCLRS